MLDTLIELQIPLERKKSRGILKQNKEQMQSVCAERLQAKRSIIIYSPYWIVNTTDSPIIYDLVSSNALNVKVLMRRLARLKTPSLPWHALQAMVELTTLYLDLCFLIGTWGAKKLSEARDRPEHICFFGGC